MGWRDWLRSKRESTNEDVLLPPGEHALEPGALSVLVEDHDLRIPNDGGKFASEIPTAEIPLPSSKCRSYLTRGLKQLKHREIMFVLPAREDRVAAGFEQDALNLPRLIYAFARDGHLVDSGDVSAFSENALFGVPYCGIAYLEPTDGPGPRVPDDALVALFLRPEEVSAARIANAYRAAAWLALAYRIFPYPQFSDPMRPAAVPPDLGESLLTKIPLLRATTQARAFLWNKTLTLRMNPGFLDNLGSALAQTGLDPCLAVITGHLPQADARVVWLKKGDCLPIIGRVGSTASTLEGGFVALLGQRAADEALVVEDGFAVQLRSNSWSAINEAITARSVVEIPMGGADDRFIRQFRIDYG